MKKNAFKILLACSLLGIILLFLPFLKGLGTSLIYYLLTTSTLHSLSRTMFFTLSIPWLIMLLHIPLSILGLKKRKIIFSPLIVTSIGFLTFIFMLIILPYSVRFLPKFSISMINMYFEYFTNNMHIVFNIIGLNIYTLFALYLITILLSIQIIRNKEYYIRIAAEHMEIKKREKQLTNTKSTIKEEIMQQESIVSHIKKQIKCDCCFKETSEIDQIFYAYGKKSSKITSENYGSNQIKTTTTTTVEMLGKLSGFVCHQCSRALIKRYKKKNINSRSLLVSIFAITGLLIIYSGIKLHFSSGDHFFESMIRWILYIIGGICAFIGLAIDINSHRNTIHAKYAVHYNKYVGKYIKGKFAYITFGSQKELDDYELKNTALFLWQNAAYFE
jgi:hypothetical protein